MDLADLRLKEVFDWQLGFLQGVKAAGPCVRMCGPGVSIRFLEGKGGMTFLGSSLAHSRKQPWQQQKGIIPVAVFIL